VGGAVRAKLFRNVRSQAVRLRADLERNGKPLAAMDLLIASHALSEGCALV
jgi:predicted nucleic acid-binding protein